MSTSAIGRLLLLLFLLSPLFVACGEEEAGEGEKIATEVDVDVDSAEDLDTGEFISDAGSFRLTFPKGSEVSKEKLVRIPTEIGPIDMHMFEVLRESDGFMVAWADFPDSLYFA